MKFQQNFNEISIRSYNRGYQAPSTALFNVDVAHLNVSAKEEGITNIEMIEMPDFIEVVVNLVPVALPSDQQYTATYQFDSKIWPSVPLYPSEETQFISALELYYAGSVRIRNQAHKDPIFIRGKIIEGMEIQVSEDKPLYTFPFEYESASIHYHVVQKRTHIPIWPAGGFYKPGCDLDQIQQVFCSLAEQEQRTLIRKTLLYQWQEQGYFPPMPIQKEDQQTIFKTERTDIYMKFIEVVRKGEIQLHIGDPYTRNLDHQPQPHFIYKSINMVASGINQAIIQFVRK